MPDNKKHVELNYLQYNGGSSAMFVVVFFTRAAGGISPAMQPGDSQETDKRQWTPDGVTSYRVGRNVLALRCPQQRGSENCFRDEFTHS